MHGSSGICRLLPACGGGASFRAIWCSEIPTIADIPTPSLVVDLVVAQRNIDLLADYARTHGLGLRPHAKTHKSLAMARRQLQAGAVGLAVSKLGEAEVMAQAAKDLLIAYPAWDGP